MNTPALALVAEDEPLLAQSMLAELSLAWPGLQTCHAADGHTALTLALERQPQVCFLDIRMPGLTGLEVAQALAEDWPAEPDAAPFPLLVFVTAYDQYALQAFEVQAVDYLVKPLTRERLQSSLQRLRQRLDERAPGNPALHSAAVSGDQALQQTLQQLRGLLGQATSAPAAPQLEVIQAQTGSLVHLVPVDEVIYFEAADKYVRVVTAEREHLIRLSLRELLPQLDSKRFWQVHRGTIVQARCIASARREESGKVTLTLRSCSDKLVASRLYAHLFKGL